MNKEFIYDNSVTELVIHRLETLPAGAVVSVGSSGDFTKENLIKSVREKNEIGKKMVEIEMTFLQGLKEGILYDTAFSGN
ncbi:hypothetical protein HYW58_02360 [Candidatus Kaiserbacteria bacterium]|nr:hypothetical protein [Candidatus Kaiserbacteria bacterium]